jgi:tRNA nucleotidyltransferase/poly(A) polymerase
MFNGCDWNSAELRLIAKNVDLAGGQFFVVGGAVRDALMGIAPVDIDLMVSGITKQRAKQIFNHFGEVSEADLISNAPVFLAKVAGFEFDVAMARKEVDTEPGKHGFVFESNPQISPLEDARRRDFTIGAIFFDMLSGHFFDPFNGMSDLVSGIIRHCDAEHFVQSPERVLRCAAQAARFGFQVNKNTYRLMGSMKPDFHTIPKEQIWRHIEKAAKLAIEPLRWLDVMTLSDWMEFFPEVKRGQVATKLAALQDKQSVPHFIAALIFNMSFLEEESFFKRICCPRKIRGQARNIKEFGVIKLPEKWVEGRDIFHVFEPGPKMGRAVQWAFIGQLNGLFGNKEEAIAWVEAHKDEI